VVVDSDGQLGTVALHAGLRKKLNLWIPSAKQSSRSSP
jgi:hypothetical protein